MGKERLTIEIDSDLMDRLRAAGVDPQAYLERTLRRMAFSGETQAEREARWARLRAEMQPGIDAYDSFVEKNGLWSDGLRLF
jgi:post-segregation antitoxin (ccd killing protein)